MDVQVGLAVEEISDVLSVNESERLLEVVVKRNSEREEN